MEFFEPTCAEPRLIPLTKARFAIVDAEDYERLARKKWYALRARNTVYACRRFRVKGRRFHVLMHREILGLKAGDPRCVDHRNYYGLDNRRANLRIATVAQNSANRQQNTKGVSFDKDRCRWKAQITVDSQNIFLGRYATAAQAHAAYVDAAKVYFGEFAHVE